MGAGYIRVNGARQHNLKNINIAVPRDSLVVVTGLSGSGKSSLAFDTIYAEGQRRYIESLSSYARQFLGRMDKPDVDFIEGLTPAIAIDQRTTSRNPRSTVGTVTEIHDYLRLLYARIGHQHCSQCGSPVSTMAIQQMVDTVMAMGDGTRVSILAPLVRGRKGEHKKLLEELLKDGFARVTIDGQVVHLSDGIQLEKNRSHTIDLIVDRISIHDGVQVRLADSMEQALKRGGGVLSVDIEGGQQQTFSESMSCTKCGISLPELEPRSFSFNSQYGACPACGGLGETFEVDPELVLDPSRSLKGGAISDLVPNWLQRVENTPLGALCSKYGIDIDARTGDLPGQHLSLLLGGAGGARIPFDYINSAGHSRKADWPYEGLVPFVKRTYTQNGSEELEALMTTVVCPECHGGRLKPESLAVTVGEQNLAQLSKLAVREALAFFMGLIVSEREEFIAHQILREVRSRLGFLNDVGLGYLTLDRSARSLSGGEAQRIRLATQIGSSLAGVIYILDEPSIGLHQRDNRMLIKSLKSLRDLGNTVIVVEHDEETMREADYIVDIGPGAGVHGGEVVALGGIADIIAAPRSMTGRYLSGAMAIDVPSVRRRPDGKALRIIGARHNNLKGGDVTIPLGLLVCITGVSGSGKSTLVNDVLLKRLQRELGRANVRSGKHDAIVGMEHLNKVIDIDQSPIGRTPRSNPATYTGTFDLIRKLFAQTQDAKVRGYGQGRFSFNMKGGRCEKCEGDGIVRIQMHFMPDVYVPCETCEGRRYNRETLEVKYKSKSIADVLAMTIDEACDFFKDLPQISRKIETMRDVGLGYITMGQPATTLSGGEAQRMKLATELSRRGTGKTLYILDEPTTGLHMADVHQLLRVLDRLVDAGNTVLVIEHNLDVIKTADWVVDLGPEGGEDGGWVIAQGTPEAVCEVPVSYTGRFLRSVLTPVTASAKA